MEDDLLDNLGVTGEDRFLDNVTACDVPNDAPLQNEGAPSDVMEDAVEGMTLMWPSYSRC